MAKIAYSKLALNKIDNASPKIIEFNGQNIEIIQYLPIEKKLHLISDIINKSVDDNNYYNPCRIDIYLMNEIIYAYTNLNLTDKQKEDVYKLYDSFINSGFSKMVMENIPVEEYNYIKSNVIKTIQSIYRYRNSAMGIFENITSDYSALDLDATELQKKMADPNNLELLKTVVTKLG